jgi:hypothetical protein
MVKVWMGGGGVGGLYIAFFEGKRGEGEGKREGEEGAEKSSTYCGNKGSISNILKSGERVFKILPSNSLSKNHYYKPVRQDLIM